MIAGADGRPLLQGVKVVDLTSVVFGPYATQILVDLGADVIKVESPGSGDAFRWSGKAAVTPGMSPGFMAINRGKHSIALDLKREEDLSVIRRLLADADVFIHNVRGKAVERLGLDYETVREIRPDIVYAHCVGFGQDGPYADLQAYDDVIQAASGTTTLLPRVDGNPRPRYLPSLIADKVAGLHAAYAVLAAIIHRMRTGEGQKVEIPMFEAFANFMLIEHLAGLTFDPPNAPAGYFRQIDPDRQPFPTSDGFISIVAYSDEAWPRVFEVLDAPEVLDDIRFASRGLRAKNLALLYRAMAQLTPSFTTAELLARCHAAQLPAQPVRDLDDIMEDPHLSATGFFAEAAHPTEGKWYTMRQPVRFGCHMDKPVCAVPTLGQWTGHIEAAEEPKA
ncbi:MAG: carnitine dehydratase [Blastomonas sp.]|jgi:crotonobetainyl-CoA:carnitine CoA-transferase CaiB-like acyl-CoA transferase|nr:carnitine dehydratase [Blastomonas sp.]|tara:strand:- start:55044 stop:56222 length:1179 start_codon:yes stop_codon:yes gene_type:complete